MTRSVWLKRALLCSAAASVLSTAARADDLSQLKSDLELLKAEVATLQARQPALPEGAAWLSIRPGQGSLSSWDFLAENGISPDQGYTFAVSPAADMPAPASEITVAATIRAQILYRDYDELYLLSRDVTTNQGDVVGYDIVGIGRDKGKGDLDVYSYNNRLSVTGKTDTAVGQVRGALLLDMDNAFGSANLKKGWGEWDMAPGWILGGGVNAGTSSLEYSPDWYLSVVDVISGTGGPTNSTIEQVRLTYSTGPFSWAIAVENSSNGDFVAGGEGDGGANLPDLASRFAWTGTGFSFDIAGAVADDNGNDTDWTIGASALISLAEKANFLIAGNYAKGYYRNFYKSAGGTSVNAIFEPFGAGSLHDFAPDGRVWSAGAGLNWAVTDTTSFNIAGGYTDFDLGDQAFGLGDPFDSNVRLTHAVANIIYTPVSQFSVGVEADWARARFDLGGANFSGKESATGWGAGVGMWWRF